MVEKGLYTANPNLNVTYNYFLHESVRYPLKNYEGIYLQSTILCQQFTYSMIT